MSISMTLYRNANSNNSLRGDYPNGNAPSLGSETLNTTVSLVADSEITPGSNELVTFGLPVAEGVLSDLNTVKVSIGGSEVGAYVAATMTHHWSDSSVRALVIQLRNVDMTGGNVIVNIDQSGSSVARLSELPHSNGWVQAGADKDNHYYPRIFAIHDLDYLSQTGIIPPYLPAPTTQDAFEDFQVAQFNNNFGSLDYSNSYNANWLFDRSTAMFKVYMTTGRVEFLKEAFLGKQFYFTYVRADGSPPAPSGGQGSWTYGTTSHADGKYIAPQQAKLALALCGDSSQWTNDIIRDMALQANLGWNQYNTLRSYDDQNQGFTERGAGLTGLAEVIAYEMTGDATVLSNMNTRIGVLKDIQQTEKSWDTSNGWTPKSGGFTHNYLVHEGSESEASAADNNTNSRAFSPWMSENIVDFLWHKYWFFGDSDVPEILRRLGNAVDNYGFTTTYDAQSVSHVLRPEFAAVPDKPRAQGSNTERASTDLLYFASAFADNATKTSSNWYPYYTDNHNIETVLTLGAAYYFETDSDSKIRLQSRILKLINGWSNSNAANIFSNVYRLFNWQHRSNSVRTWDWIAEQ